MRSAKRSVASPIDRPIVCDSTIWRNSLRTGSSASVAMMRKQSPTGRPALTPRMMMSTEPGNASMNLATRRFAMKAQQPMRKPEAGRRRRRRARRADRCSARRSRERPRTPTTPEPTIKAVRDDGRGPPARCAARASRFLVALVSMSFRLSAISLRRLAGSALRPVASALARRQSAPPCASAL